MAAEAEALAARYVVDTPRPADRDGWGEMWAGYCAFYAVADAAGKAEVVWHWLLDPAHPVAQRVPVAVNLASRSLPLAVGLDEGLERAQELAPVVVVGDLDRAEDGLAVMRFIRACVR